MNKKEIYEKAFNELMSLSDEEFYNELEKRKNGDIAKAFIELGIAEYLWKEFKHNKKQDLPNISVFFDEFQDVRYDEISDLYRPKCSFLNLNSRAISYNLSYNEILFEECNSTENQGIEVINKEDIVKRMVA